MRRLKLRTQLMIVAIFLGVYSAAIGVSFRVQGKAQGDLERSFREDLATLTKLPRLGDLLRHQALLTQQFLLTGQRQWIDGRRHALDASRRLNKDLLPLLSRERERDISDRLDAELASHLSEQESWIDRRRQGRLSLGGSPQVVSRQTLVESLSGILVEMRDANMAELQSRREASRWAAQLTFYLTLATGLIIGASLVVFLSFYVIGALTRLERYASNWRLGQEWRLEPASSGLKLKACSCGCARCLSGSTRSFLRRGSGPV